MLTRLPLTSPSLVLTTTSSASEPQATPANSNTDNHIGVQQEEGNRSCMQQERESDKCLKCPNTFIGETFPPAD